MTRKTTLLAFVLLLAPGQPAQAEWVTERLYLGLYPEPDTSTSPLKMLPTGEEVEILQRQGDFVQLRLDDGTQGWARTEFIAEQPPAVVRIDQIVAERDQLRQQVEQIDALRGQVAALKRDLAQANSTAAQLRNRLQSEQQENAQQASAAVEDKQLRIDSLKTQLSNTEQRAATLESQVQSLQSRVERNEQRSENMLLKIAWVLGSMLVSLIIGIALGARWMAARVRRRFSGLKVW